MTDAVVVIDGDTIRAAGDRNTVSIPPGSEVIDLPGATILPGFINTHVHNAYELVNLQRWAREGVTTVRDLGARWDGSKDYFFLAGYYTDHVAKAARLIPAGPLVTVSDGYPIAGARFPSLAVTSPADAREQIEGLIADGARVIKITITVGGPPTLSLDQAAAIVDTAHGRGVPVSAHVTDVASLRRALDAGVDDIAHSITDRMPEELIARMIDQDVSWVPTLAIQQGAGADNLMRFVEAGGRVALGNDAGYLSGVVIGMPVKRSERWRKPD
jgi:imidazolonepropionase-like amidohydrolase